MSNSYKAQRKSRARVVFFVLLIIIYLLGVTTYDAFIATPKKTERVEQVMTSFLEFKTFMDGKLPEMDSALIRHEQQIKEQNIQLKDLNELTAVLKEGNED